MYYDYAAQSIDSDANADKKYTPVATFANEGTLDDQSGYVYAEILDGETEAYKDSLEASIPSESSEQFTFSEWTVPHDGSYTLKVYPWLELDEYADDDTLMLELTGVGITEPDPHPSDPFLEVTAITGGVLKVYFETPERQIGNLTLYDATGRRIEQLTVTGAESITIPALASGVYFVRLDAGFRVCTEKVVVFK